MLDLLIMHALKKGNLTLARIVEERIAEGYPIGAALGLAFAQQLLYAHEHFILAVIVLLGILVTVANWI
jgi:hypothetical protein